MRHAWSLTPYMSHLLNLLFAQNLKAHNDESEVSNHDSEFDAYAVELESNLDDLIVYD